MEKGSNIVPYSSSENRIGASNLSQAYESITRVKHEDKQSGSYQRFTTKEKVSTGNLHVERGSHRVGVKDEYTTSSTIKIGNKRGYTEYSYEERIRDVKFGDSNKEQKVIGGFESANNGYDYGVGVDDDDANRSYGSDDEGNEYYQEAEPDNNYDPGFVDYGNEVFDNGYSYDDGNCYSDPGSAGDYSDDDDY